MKAHTTEYKENLITYGRELDYILKRKKDNQFVLIDSERILYANRSFQSDLLKTVMKQLDLELNTNIEEKEIISFQFGIKTNENFEYLSEEKYQVYKSERLEDSRSYKLICYDKMLNTMINYDGTNIIYPITVRDYINTIATKCGLVFANKNDTFVNWNKIISEDHFSNGDYTFRDVLDYICEIVAGWLVINENDELEIKYPTETNEELTGEFLRNINVTFKNKFGAVDSVVFSRGAGSDNIYRKEVDNPQYEIKIIDNPFLEGLDREDFIDEVYNKLKGLEFYIMDVSTFGIGYLEVGDLYSFKITEEQAIKSGLVKLGIAKMQGEGSGTFKCLMLNSEIDFSGGMIEDIYVEEPEKSETNYKLSSTTDRSIKNAVIMTDKNNARINQVVKNQETIQSNLQENYYTKTTTNELIQDTVNGLVNQYTVAGGNNLFRNTGLYYTSYDYSSGFEFWEGSVKKVNNINSQSGTSMYLQNDILSQTQEVPNNEYTVSFKYNRLNPLANASVTINEVEYELQENGVFEHNVDVRTNQIEIIFNSDTVDGYEIYELMVNYGNLALAYSQNQNETKTDTVEISEGIKIESSKTDSILKANADGIRIENKSGNTTTEFLDTGTKTESIEANKGTIANLLIQEVDGQIWLTGIGR